MLSSFCSWVCPGECIQNCRRLPWYIHVFASCFCIQVSPVRWQPESTSPVRLSTLANKCSQDRCAGPEHFFARKVGSNYAHAPFIWAVRQQLATASQPWDCARLLTNETDAGGYCLRGNIFVHLHKHELGASLSRTLSHTHTLSKKLYSCSRRVQTADLVTSCRTSTVLTSLTICFSPAGTATTCVGRVSVYEDDRQYEGCFLPASIFISIFSFSFLFFLFHLSEVAGIKPCVVALNAPEISFLSVLLTRRICWARGT